MKNWVIQLKTGDNWRVQIKDVYAKKHWHPEMEIVYIINGSIEVDLEGKKHLVGPRSLMFIPSGVVHHFREDDKQNLICVIRYNMQLLDCYSDDAKNFYREFFSDLLITGESEEIDRIMGFVPTALETTDKIQEETNMLSVFYMLCQVLISDPKLILVREAHPKNQEAETMTKMQGYIQDHLREKIMLKDVADYLGFSESYCSRYIKKKTKMTFLEYLNNERMDIARNELSKSGAPVTEVAFMTGFSSIQSFNRIFKQYFGMSPSDYRKKKKEV